MDLFELAVAELQLVVSHRVPNDSLRICNSPLGWDRSRPQGHIPRTLGHLTSGPVGSGRWSKPIWSQKRPTRGPKHGEVVA